MIIRAHDIIKITEEYFKAKTFRSNYVEVFVNPSQAELRQVASKDSRSIRFTADARSPQKVFVWNASLAIHYEMLPLVGSDRSDSYPYIIGGVARQSGSNFVMVGWDQYHHVISQMNTGSRDNVINYLTKLFGYNWTWLDRYFKATDYINDKEKDFLSKVKIPAKVSFL